jgi:DNA-directed RNA polymerase subunit RPC12/RpoP
MRVECKNCGCRIGEMAAYSGLGCVLRLLCGVVPGYLVVLLVTNVVRHIRPAELALAVLCAGLLIWAYCLFWVFCPGFFSWWKHRKTPCPKCGQRRWTWGFTEGWGL